MSGQIQSRQFHVAIGGDDSNDGSLTDPLRHIQTAAERARPGDTVIVHEGVYRERVNPPRGGSSFEEPITFQAAPGENVCIKGSERIQTWEPLERGGLWRVCLPNSFFGELNPYREEVRGDWFRPLPDAARVYHTGAVYLNGHWLKEAASYEALMESDEALWLGEVRDDGTILTARFAGIDPNLELVEINVRESVFYPDRPGRNFITVRGFRMEHAACNWAPPTAEQVGLLGTHWSRGWVIEDNTICYAMCCGITLGKYGDDWDNRAESAEGYVGTIRRAHERGWQKGKIGHHTVRNNLVSHCEQAGIVGSMGCAFSTVTGNQVHHINTRAIFAGEEMAGIKFHGAIDTLIAHNTIHHCHGFGGIWLDWMTQGTRVHANVLHHNLGQDLFVEVNHGPFLVDHNLFLSATSLWEASGGGAYVHNLFAGRIELREEPDRETPCHPPHSTEIQHLAKVQGDDERFFNNLFTGGNGLSAYYEWNPSHLQAAGNRYLGTARPGPTDIHFSLQEQAQITAELRDDHFSLSLPPEEDPPERRIITSGQLGRAAIPDLGYEDSDGSLYRLDQDFNGQPHNTDSPSPGPFAGTGSNTTSKKS